MKVGDRVRLSDKGVYNFNGSDADRMICGTIVDSGQRYDFWVQWYGYGGVAMHSDELEVIA